MLGCREEEPLGGAGGAGKLPAAATPHHSGTHTQVDRLSQALANPDPAHVSWWSEREFEDCIKQHAIFHLQSLKLGSGPLRLSLSKQSPIFKALVEKMCLWSLAGERMGNCFGCITLLLCHI